MRLARIRLRRFDAPTAVSLAIVAACTAFVIWQVHPSLVLRDTVPARGDLVSHVYAPDFLRHVLADGRWTGWSPDWFAGFPLYLFYPVLPAILVLLADVALPYTVAFKVVAVLGVVTLPAAAWAFGRMSGLPSPYPALFSVASLAFVFDTSCNLCGGNLAATVAGEFAYALAMPLALVAAGTFVRALRTSRGWPAAAVLLGLAALAHPVPTLWMGALVLGAVAAFWTGSKEGLPRRALGTIGAGALLAGLWWIPFLLLRGYMTVPNFEKRTQLRFWLLPYHWWWEVTIAALAVVGVYLAARAGRRLPVVIAAVTVLAGIAFVVAPEGQLWNLRLIPFWYLGRMLLVAAGIAELALIAPDLGRLPSLARRTVPAAPVVALVATVIAIGSVWGTLPGASRGGDVTTGSASVSWLGFTFGGTPQRWWAEEAFKGLEGRDDWPELRGLITAMERVGRRHGCGTASWDRQDRQGQNRQGNTEDLVFGGDGALTLLPYFTDGCIDSLDGILRDSSATTRHIQLAQSLTSVLPEQWVVGLPYERFSLGRGLDQLRRFGVRYYLTRGGEAAAAARQFEHDLQLVASPGPWQVWHMKNSGVVAALDNEPAVVSDQERLSWNELSVLYGRTQEADIVPVTADGPPGWQRVGTRFPTPRPVPATTVSAVKVGRDDVSFRVGRTGVPTLVRVSWFPGWRAEGADGPYRATPNVMVVVPTEREVRLSRTRTGPEWLGILSGVAGLVAVGALMLGERRRRHAPAPARAPKRPAARAATGRPR